jgi:hypothetical protein
MPARARAVFRFSARNEETRFRIRSAWRALSFSDSL